MYPYIQLWSLCSSEHVAHGNHTVAHSFYQPPIPFNHFTPGESLVEAAPTIRGLSGAAHCPLEPALETSWAVPHPAEAGSSSSWAACCCCCFHLPAAPQCSYCQLRRRTSSYSVYYLPQLNNYDLSYATTAPTSASTCSVLVGRLIWYTAHTSRAGISHNQNFLNRDRAHLCNFVHLFMLSDV